MTEEPLLQMIRSLMSEVEERVRRALEPRILEVLRERNADQGTLAQLVSSGNVFLKLEAAARIADCHPKTIRRLMEEGRLCRHSVGSDPRIRLGDLVTYLARNSDAESVEEIRRRAREAVNHG